MIYLLRHGELDTGKKKQFIGQIQIPLSRKGKDQAFFWKTALASVKLDAIFSSDLDRTLDTASIISTPHKLEVKPVSAFREIDLGAWEGRSFDGIKSDFPDAFKQRGKDIENFQPPLGESFKDLYRRVVPAFENLTSIYPGKEILIVAHAGVNRIILSHLLNHPLSRLFDIPQDYAAMNMIDNTASPFPVLKINAKALSRPM